MADRAESAFDLRHSADSSHHTGLVDSVVNIVDLAEEAVEEATFQRP